MQFSKIANIFLHKVRHITYNILPRNIYYTTNYSQKIKQVRAEESIPFEVKLNETSYIEEQVNYILQY